MAVLITGGAGYIGGMTARSFIKRGEQVVILYDLSKSRLSSVPNGAVFYEGKINNKDIIKQITEEHNITACRHFAAFIEVGESVKNLYKYFYNNTASSLELFSALIECGVKKIVFSSTAAVYDEPQYTPIDEEHIKNPTNPYGLSKYFMEKILESFSVSHGLTYAVLRYFNACGADEMGNWEPQYKSIDVMISSAWEWHKNNREGYL